MLKEVGSTLLSQNLFTRFNEFWPYFKRGALCRLMRRRKWKRTDDHDKGKRAKQDKKGKRKCGIALTAL